MTAIKTIKKGRPNDDIEVRQLRSWVWYVVVKRKSVTNGKEMTDYDLDGLFGTDDSMEPMTGNDRRKMFESMRTKGSIPTGYVSFTKDGVYNLIDAVERNPRFSGTADLIHSPFWRFLDSKPLSLREIRSLIVACVQRLGIEKMPGHYIDDLSDDFKSFVIDDPQIQLQEYLNIQNSRFDAGYDEAMTYAFGSLKPSLDLIGLICGFAFEAIRAGKIHIAHDHIKTFNLLIDEFCRIEEIGTFVQKNQGRKTNAISIDLKKKLKDIAAQRMYLALQDSPLMTLPVYEDMFDESLNKESAVIALLNRHQRLLWR
ncbi:MAG TPA: hypothetical protein VK974_01190 [Methylophilaceae bacterium]|nr:hypothetical protein [Methylophilaceae bacterium]